MGGLMWASMNWTRLKSVEARLVDRAVDPAWSAEAPDHETPANGTKLVSPSFGFDGRYLPPEALVSPAPAGLGAGL
jgi:hypothetical protein